MLSIFLSKLERRLKKYREMTRCLHVSIDILIRFCIIIRCALYNSVAYIIVLNVVEKYILTLTDIPKRCHIIFRCATHCRIKCNLEVEA